MIPPTAPKVTHARNLKRRGKQFRVTTTKQNRPKSITLPPTEQTTYNHQMLRKLRFPLILLALILTAAAISIALKPEWLKIQTVQLELNPDSNEQLLFQRINDSLRPRTEKLEGQYIWKVTLPEIYELIQQDKRVKTISLYREFPNIIKAKITPHTPVMAYLSTDNRFYPIAMDATLLPALPQGEFPDMPVLRGEELKDDPALRATAIELFNTVGTEGTIKRSSISEIIYSNKEGFRIFLNQTSGEIKLGDSDFGPKLSRVQKVLSYLESQNVRSRVIDARFSKKVVVRVRNSP